MQIAVLAEHIEQGVKANCYKCPIAQAISWAMGREAAVTPYSIYVGGVHYDLPEEAREFVQLFDEGCVVEPFTFEIEGLER